MEKTTRVSIRLSETELSTIKENAAETGLTVSDFIRDRAVKGMEQVLYDPQIREAVLEALALLREMAGFLHEHSKDPAQQMELRELSAQLSEILDTLTEALKGGKLDGHYETTQD